MKHIYIITLCLLLTACGGHYKSPSMSGDPAKMSADTLCFRYASGKDPSVGAEIERRNIDCTALLHEDPLYSGASRDLDASRQMTR